MSIPETTLTSWTNRGGLEGSQSLHNAIRTAVQAHSWPRNQYPDVYLQGSYRNYTNIRGDSDVDVVVQYDGVIQSDLSMLNDLQKARYHATYPDATYGWLEFREDVRRALAARFGESAVKRGKKTLKVLAGQGRLHADVVVAWQYRRYADITTIDETFTEGLTFYVPAESRWVVNYPKIHYQRGNEKQARTSEYFKPAVRMFKNARRYMVERQMMERDLAPSYFIECFLSNLPDSVFLRPTWAETFREALIQMRDIDKSTLVCQHRQFPLCDSANPELWRVDKAEAFVGALIDLWNEWGK